MVKRVPQMWPYLKKWIKQTLWNSNFHLQNLVYIFFCIFVNMIVNINHFGHPFWKRVPNFGHLVEKWHMTTALHSNDYNLFMGVRSSVKDSFQPVFVANFHSGEKNWRTRNGLFWSWYQKAVTTEMKLSLREEDSLCFLSQA